MLHCSNTFILPIISARSSYLPIKPQTKGLYAALQQHFFLLFLMKPTQLLLHAACADSLQRARNNATHFLYAEPDAHVVIVANAGAVEMALSQPHPTDPLLKLCSNTLKNIKKQATTQEVVPAAIAYIVQKQKEGWLYVRA